MAIDGCVVGRWVATRVVVIFSVTGAVVTLAGGAGLVLTFLPNGSETANWTPMGQLTTTIPVDVTESYRGISTYRVATRGHKLSFLSANYSSWLGQENWPGTVYRLSGAYPIQAEAYTCSRSTFTEANASWKATFRRD